MKKYPAYKNSGIEWLGEIPEHWELKRLKHLVKSPLKYGANESAEDDDRSNPRYIRITDFGNDGKLREDTFKALSPEKAEPYLLEEGDLLFARSGATVGKTFLFKNYENKACFAGYLIKASFDSASVHSGYINYYTQSSYYENWKQSIFQQATIQNIGADKYNQLALAVPNTIEEQIAIANYLDRKTSQIDTLIHNKEKLIALLQEERIALINQAVTKGLNPDVPMKDSGIEWLGEIPEHWEINRIASLAECITGYAFKSDSFSFDGGTKLVRGDNVTEGHLRWGDKTRYWNEVTPDLEKFLLDEFDILIGMDGSKVGKNYAMVNAEDLPLLLVQRVARIRTKSPLIAKLISHTVSTYNFRYYINLSKTDPAIPHITLKNIKDYIVLMPPLDELEELICQLESNIQRIDSTLDKVQKEIELLKEYKIALISEVVTGKIDVREEVLEFA